MLDEVALEERYRYIFANSVKEGLVEDPRDWPGIHAYRALCEGEEIEGVWIEVREAKGDRVMGAEAVGEVCLLGGTC